MRPIVFVKDNIVYDLPHHLRCDLRLMEEFSDDGPSKISALSLADDSLIDDVRLANYPALTSKPILGISSPSSSY